jgi:hypothetical protein
MLSLSAVLAVTLQQLVQLVLLLLEEAMAALALQQQVQLVQLEEPPAAPHRTPPAPRLRLL